MEKRTGKRRPDRAAQPQQAQRRRPSSKLTAWILALLLVGFGVQIYYMYSQLQSARREEAVYAQRLAELREQNQRLRSVIENSGSLSLIEDIARDQFGYVSEGEKVFRFGRG